MSDEGKPPGDEGKGKLYNWPGRTPEYQEARKDRAGRRSDQRKSARRPGWWTPEGVIERLRDGWHVVDLVQDAMKGAGAKIKIRSLHDDIATWKREVPGFEADYKAALRLRTGADRDKFSDHWHELFFDALEECRGDLEHACAMTGVGIGIVHALRNPDSKAHYHKGFAERVRIIEGERIGRIEQKFLRHAEDDFKGRGDPKVQEKVLASRLPHLYNPKTRIAVEGKVDINITQRIENAVMEQSAARRRVLFGDRTPAAALPAADERPCIDVSPEEPMRERAEAALGTKLVEALESEGYRILELDDAALSVDDEDPKGKPN